RRPDDFCGRHAVNPMRRPLLAVAVLHVVAATGFARADEPVRVTVVVVLATAANSDVDPKLAGLAAEVRKKAPALTGFAVAATLEKSIPVGDDHTFELPEKQSLKVTVERPKGADGRVGLTIAPPGLGEITYSCACSKFFPVVTPFKTKAGDVMILAVMAKPCTGNGGPKP
ncbi:MAG: hypothetical protein ACRC7O_11995, partial [Fimbriiglobus sp.]